jgi:hypothetical protein
MGFVLVGLRAAAGRDVKQVHAHALAADGFFRDSLEIIEPLLAGIGAAGA